MSKGQSAIEYLTTYGWMLVVVAIVGGAIFTTLQNSAQIQSVSGLANADVQIDDFGITETDGLALEMIGSTRKQVENVKVSIKDEETGKELYSCSEKTIPVAESETLHVAGVESSENTNEYSIEIRYDSGSLEGLTEEGTLTGKLSLNKSISCKGEGNVIFVSGGEISKIEMQGTLRLGTEGYQGCLGDLCDQINSGDRDNPVKTSGDNMTSTLTVTNLLNLSDCIVTEGKQGGACKLSSTSDSGELTSTNNIMYGQLSTPTLKTQRDTCVGGKC